MMSSRGEQPYKQSKYRDMEFVYAGPCNAEPDDQRYKWNNASIDDVPRHWDPFLQRMRIEDVDVVYKEHSVERLNEELYLFPCYQSCSNFRIETGIY